MLTTGDGRGSTNFDLAWGAIVAGCGRCGLLLRLLDELLVKRLWLVLVGVECGLLAAVVGRRVVGRHGPQLPEGHGWNTGGTDGCALPLAEPALCRLCETGPKHSFSAAHGIRRHHKSHTLLLAVLGRSHGPLPGPGLRFGISSALVMHFVHIEHISTNPITSSLPVCS